MNSAYTIADVHPTNLTTSHVDGTWDQAKVIFDYEAEDESNITIRVGDIVVVIDKSNADWWEGHVKGKDLVGFFPASFVKLITEESSTNEDIINKTIRRLRKKLRQIKHLKEQSLKRELNHEEKVKVDSEINLESSLKKAEMMKGPFPLNAVVTKSFNSVPSCGSDDEISIEEGDLVVVQGPDERCPEDWFKGFVRMRDSQFLKNPRVGIFPADYVRLLTKDDTVEIKDPDFVPEGFHENCRDENGAVKITAENRHLYQDVNYLSRIYKEDRWAQTPGVLYTREMTACPNGRLPTLEALMSLQLSGHKLHGRIMMNKNDVFDADTQNKLESLTPDKLPFIMQDFQRKNMWEKSEDARLPPTVFTIAKNVDGVVDDGSYMKIPEGKYERKEITHKKTEEGVACFMVCDEPTCCLMTQALISMSAVGAFDSATKGEIMGMFKNRTMYKKYDSIKGNVEMCHYCLHHSYSV